MGCWRSGSTSCVLRVVHFVLACRHQRDPLSEQVRSPKRQLDCCFVCDRSCYFIIYVFDVLAMVEVSQTRSIRNHEVFCHFGRRHEDCLDLQNILACVLGQTDGLHMNNIFYGGLPNDHKGRSVCVSAGTVFYVYFDRNTCVPTGTSKFEVKSWWKSGCRFDPS